MAHEEVTQYKCDRCGKVVVCASSDCAPPGWMTVTSEAIPSVNDGAPNAAAQWEICDSCYLNMARYLQQQDRPDNSAKPAPNPRLREVNA